jgi:diadenosine tetraphosphatase ApaH/serine/threonine PP2A family protein phosphatase
LGPWADNRGQFQAELNIPVFSASFFCRLPSILLSHRPIGIVHSSTHPTNARSLAESAAGWKHGASQDNNVKFAILADIHANLEALQAVLEHARQQGCTQYAFLGDFVGYCADPKACVEIVRSMNAPCVKGNHDEYCGATDGPLEAFNPNAAKFVEWTRKQLAPDERQWLHNLPYVLQVENFTIVHATLDGPQRWGYVFDKLAAARSLASQGTELCFFGHTHVPVAFILDTTVRGGTYTKLKIERGKRYFVNSGAVGQPRDNNPRAAYVTYDLQSAMVELHRVDYDFATTQRKIKEAGLAGL